MLNKDGLPIKLSSLWGTRVKAKSLQILCSGNRWVKWNLEANFCITLDSCSVLKTQYVILFTCFFTFQTHRAATIAITIRVVRHTLTVTPIKTSRDMEVSDWTTVTLSAFVIGETVWRLSTTEAAPENNTSQCLTRTQLNGVTGLVYIVGLLVNWRFTTIPLVDKTCLYWELWMTVDRVSDIRGELSNVRSVYQLPGVSLVTRQARREFSNWLNHANR